MTRAVQLEELLEAGDTAVKWKGPGQLGAPEARSYGRGDVAGTGRGTAAGERAPLSSSLVRGSGAPLGDTSASWLQAWRDPAPRLWEWRQAPGVRVAAQPQTWGTGDATRGGGLR